MLLKKHKKFLLLAHEYSKKFYGLTYPNPCVGCLIVDYSKNPKGQLLSFGYTSESGRPHAEENALNKVKKINNTSIMYLTLEPCHHKSTNKSCVNQIINSGIKKIYIAHYDPDARTKYKSIIKLRKNNIDVNYGITKNIFKLNNNFFITNKKYKRSFIRYKMAISKDYMISEKNTKKRWISNHLSRKYAHQLRNDGDAILTTSETINKDNSILTTRLKKYNKYKNTIIILDRKLKINLSSKIIKSASKRKVIIFTKNKDKEKINYLMKKKCKIIYLKNELRLFNLNQIVKKTYKLGICNILVEAGGKLFTNMIKAKVIDEIHIFKTTKKIGKNGIPMYTGKKSLTINSLRKKIVERKKFANNLYYRFNLR